MIINLMLFLIRPKKYVNYDIFLIISFFHKPDLNDKYKIKEEKKEDKSNSLTQPSNLKNVKI